MASNAHIKKLCYTYCAKILPLAKHSLNKRVCAIIFRTLNYIRATGYKNVEYQKLVPQLNMEILKR